MKNILLLSFFGLFLSISMESCVMRTGPAAVAVRPAPIVVSPAPVVRPVRKRVVVVRPRRCYRGHRTIIIR